MPADPVLPGDYPARIKQMRGRLGLTQAELAARLGVSFVTVNRWENGQTKPSPLAWSQILNFDEDETTRAGAEAEPAAPPVTDFTGSADVVRVLAEGERLSFGHMFNPAFATEVAQIDPLPHQRIAVYEHMLKQSPLRFLLADDAGAGKTIMSGLYIREGKARRLIKRVLDRRAGGADRQLEKRVGDSLQPSVPYRHRDRRQKLEPVRGRRQRLDHRQRRHAGRGEDVRAAARTRRRAVRPGDL